MKINENKWVSVGSIRDFVNKPNTAVDPCFDWFISSLVANLKNYQISDFIKGNITIFVYLLLNPKFQIIIRKIRDAFDIPINGFTSENDFYQWRNNFYQAINDYKNAKKIPLKLNKIITYTEKQIIRLSKGTWNIKVFLDNPEDIFSIIVVKRLNIGQDYNFHLWGAFIYHLIFTFNPQQLLQNSVQVDSERNKLKISQDGFFNTTTITIPLNLDSTVNSLKTIIENNKNLIQDKVKQLKEKSSITSIESLEIERDYLLFKSYVPFKGTKRSNKGYGGNIRKQDFAFEQTKHLFKFKTEEEMYDYEEDNIVKIINKMRKRIKQSFTDKSDAFGNLLSEIESTVPSPYPEYVENRS